MKRIIYLSTGVTIFSDFEINDLLNVSRINNAKNGITGLLLYSDGNFLQIIEGENEMIDQLYINICKDRRHKNIINVVNKSIQERSFSNWEMGFSVVDINFLNNNPEINPFKIKTINTLDSVINSFIHTFLQSFRNQILYC